MFYCKSCFLEVMFYSKLILQWMMKMQINIINICIQ